MQTRVNGRGLHGWNWEVCSFCGATLMNVRHWVYVFRSISTVLHVLQISAIQSTPITRSITTSPKQYGSNMTRQESTIPTFWISFVWYSHFQEAEARAPYIATHPTIIYLCCHFYPIGKYATDPYMPSNDPAYQLRIFAVNEEQAKIAQGI